MAISKREQAIRNDRILDSAYKLFVERRIDNVSIQNIADEAKIGVASVYRYYPNKTLLLVAVCGKKWKEYLESEPIMQKFEEAARHDAMGQLRAVLNGYVDLYRERKDLLVFNDDFNHFITRRKADGDYVEYWNALSFFDARLKKMYDIGKEDKTIRTDIPYEEFTRVTFHTMMGVCNHYAGGILWGAAEDNDYSKEIEAVRDMILAYVAPKK